MWTPRSEKLANARGMRFTIDLDSRPATFSDVVLGWQTDAGFRTLFNGLLHAAAMQGHATICEILIGVGAEVNVQTIPQGYAPLHSAAFAGHVDAIRALLAKGADRTLANYRNEQPADTARRTGQTEAVRVLQT